MRISILICSVCIFASDGATAFSSCLSIEGRTALGNSLTNQHSLSSSFQSSTALNYRDDPEVNNSRQPGRQGKPSFMSRMRNLATRRSSSASVIEKKRVNEHIPHNQDRSGLVQAIHTLDEYQELIRMDQSAEDKPIIVIQWHAKWCKACQAVQPLYHKMAKKYHKEHDLKNVKFVSILVTEKNKNLHQDFVGVPCLPYGHIYHPTFGIVEELKLTKPHLGRFEQAIQWYVSGCCELPSGSTEETRFDFGFNPEGSSDESL